MEVCHGHSWTVVLRSSGHPKARIAQLSKQIVRVRFSSPAPQQNASSKASSRFSLPGIRTLRGVRVLRARSVRGPGTGRPSLVPGGLQRRGGCAEQVGQLPEFLGVGTALRGGVDDEHWAWGARHRVGVPVQVQLPDEGVVDAHPAAGGFFDIVAGPQGSELGTTGQELADKLRGAGARARLRPGHGASR
jgi:hypothetical protein